MDKVAETSVIVERKREESTEASDPKTVCPGTRKRPASEVDAETARDEIADRGESSEGDGASKPKKSRLRVVCEEDILAFDKARGGMKKEWDRASGEGQKLSTMMRDTDDWIQKKFKPDISEFERLSRMDRSKGEAKKRYDELWKKELTRLELFEDLRALTREAIKMVRNCECEEDLLEQMNGLTERLCEMRESN